MSDLPAEPKGAGEWCSTPPKTAQAQVFLRAEGGTVWLSQAEMAALFQTTKQNISLHVRNLLAEGELLAGATVKDHLTVQTEGKRQVRRSVQFYSLDMILAVGYRVKSPRGTQFRQWATAHLREYLVKGFVLDDERLKDPQGWDYFDELLAAHPGHPGVGEALLPEGARPLRAVGGLQGRRRRGRAASSPRCRTRCSTPSRSAPPPRSSCSAPTPANPTWRSPPGRPTACARPTWWWPRTTSMPKEIEELNRIASMFLDYAEDRAQQRKDLRMNDWRDYVNRFVAFNERPLLQGAGKVSRERMEQVAYERYAAFDAQRRLADAAGSRCGRHRGAGEGRASTLVEEGEA